IYRDRPREEWQYSEDGELQMATIPLDLDGVMAQLPQDAADGDGAGMEAGTRIGHVHLQVSDIGPAEKFYEHGLGFDVVVRSYPGALFVSAGGYHHHIGMNTWNSTGGSPPPPGTRGRLFQLTRAASLPGFHIWWTAPRGIVSVSPSRRTRSSPSTRACTEPSSTSKCSSCAGW